MMHLLHDVLYISQLFEAFIFNDDLHLLDYA
jgi:hypothetical protein